MHVSRSASRRPAVPDTAVSALLAQVSRDRLRSYVESLAFPRHYLAERSANVRARDILLAQLRGLGYEPSLQGEYENIVARTGEGDGPCLLLGAHYDSVPGTPGADDNGSAVAACLECARLLKQSRAAAQIVFFNREEDGLLGSTEFVTGLPYPVSEAHVFEMVGYRSRAPGSQRMPPGIPGFLGPDVGDFLGLLSNRRSNDISEALLGLAATYIPALPVVALKVHFGVERLIGHLLRSDHAPFWDAGIPAVMCTDTADFRNPNYHRASDTPETLDYDFLTEVTRLALGRALGGAHLASGPSPTS
jgi:Zn-dependent M28 family amino/carboxypeptidase